MSKKYINLLLFNLLIFASLRTSISSENITRIKPQTQSASKFSLRDSLSDVFKGRSKKSDTPTAPAVQPRIGQRFFEDKPIKDETSDPNLYKKEADALFRTLGSIHAKLFGVDNFFVKERNQQQLSSNMQQWYELLNALKKYVDFYSPKSIKSGFKNKTGFNAFYSVIVDNSNLLINAIKVAQAANYTPVQKRDLIAKFQKGINQLQLENLGTLSELQLLIQQKKLNQREIALANEIKDLLNKFSLYLQNTLQKGIKGLS